MLARLVRALGVTAELVIVRTSGDRIQDVSLAKLGGKGLFVKELEVAMAEGRADLAVHSMKDVPAELPPGYALAAITEREDPRDALVSTRYATHAELPPGAVVGTSSLRRQAQVAERFPGLVIRPLRGNVETRLAKLDRGEYAAIVLAGAGLKRLGLGGRIRACLAVEESLPSAGQAALGIECLEARSDVKALVAPLADVAASACVRAEREVNRALGGSCTIPLGAYAQADGARLRLRALVASPKQTKKQSPSDQAVSDLHNKYFRPLERLLSTELVGIDAFREATGLGRKWLAIMGEWGVITHGVRDRRADLFPGRRHHRAVNGRHGSPGLWPQRRV